MRRLTTRLIGLALAGLLVARCGTSDSVIVLIDDVPDTLLVSVPDTILITMGGTTVVTSTLNMQVGQTAQLSASALNDLGLPVGGLTIEWSSSNESVVSVDPDGLVHALAPGNANVTASAAGITAIVPVAVASSLGTLILTPPSVTLVGLGSSTQLTLTAQNAQGGSITPTGTTWGSTDPSVASVNGVGLVSAEGLGTARIWVSNPCCSGDTTNVTVISEPASGTFEFYSDWRSGTGSGNDATSDGGRWNSVTSDAEIMDVTPGAPYGWTRTANVLRIRGDGTGNDAGVAVNTPYFQTRTSFYVRWWFWVDTDGDASFSHSPSFPQSGALVWGWDLRNFGTGYSVGGGWGPLHSNSTEYRTGIPGVGERGLLQYRTWYRFEAYIEFGTDSGGNARWRSWPRIYSDAGVLLFDADDFVNELNAASLQSRYDAGQYVEVSSAAANGARQFFLGMGEAAWTRNEPTDVLLYGAPALSTGGWIGDALSP